MKMPRATGERGRLARAERNEAPAAAPGPPRSLPKARAATAVPGRMPAESWRSHATAPHDTFREPSPRGNLPPRTRAVRGDT